jgi:hypothetical protein
LCKRSGANVMSLNIRRLISVLLLTTLAPLAIGVLIDVTCGTAPFATLIVGLLSIPIASVVVGWSTLSEFNALIQKIAPEEDPDRPDQVVEALDGNV